MRYVTLLLLFLVSCSTLLKGETSVTGLTDRDLREAFQGDPAALEKIYRLANASFESKKYDVAIEYYQILIKTGWAADSLYLNLGTSYFRNGSPGRAALWFRRASHLTPGMPEVKQNFKFLKQTQGILEFSDEDWKRLLLSVSPSLLRSSASLLLWIALFSFAMLWLVRRSNWRPILAVALVFSLCGCVFMFFLSGYRAKNLAPVNFATVVVPGTSALVAPAPDSKPVIDLPEGSEIRIIEDTGPWLYAQIPQDYVGWIHHTSVERNWPIPDGNAGL